MDTRPIGVFDSGLGGLTAVRELRRQMPSEHIIYFGDTSRVPYGNRSRETLLKYARQDLRFLASFQPKAVVIACGTVSSNCIETLQAENQIPIIGVVEPAVARAASVTRNRRVGLIATRASVSSGAYQRRFAAIAPEITLIGRPCPLFVPLVEEGRVHPGDSVIETVAAEYLTPCGRRTSTPWCWAVPTTLLREVIGAVMGPDVTLIDVGQEAASAARAYIEAHDAAAASGSGDVVYCTSDRPADFERMARLFLYEDMEHSPQLVDIEAY